MRRCVAKDCIAEGARFPRFTCFYQPPHDTREPAMVVLNEPFCERCWELYLTSEMARQDMHEFRAILKREPVAVALDSLRLDYVGADHPDVAELEMRRAAKVHGVGYA